MPEINERFVKLRRSRFGRFLLRVLDEAFPSLLVTETRIGRDDIHPTLSYISRDALKIQTIPVAEGNRINIENLGRGIMYVRVFSSDFQTVGEFKHFILVKREFYDHVVNGTPEGRVNDLVGVTVDDYIKMIGDGVNGNTDQILSPKVQRFLQVPINAERVEIIISRYKQSVQTLSTLFREGFRFFSDRSADHVVLNLSRNDEGRWQYDGATKNRYN